MIKDMLYKDIDIIISTVDLVTTYGKEIAKQYKVCNDIIQNLSDESI